MEDNQFSYTVDAETFEVKVFHKERVMIRQPFWLPETPFPTYESAKAWGEIFVNSISNPDYEYELGTPEEPYKLKEIVEDTTIEDPEDSSTNS